MLEAESVVKDKITLTVNEKYLEITVEEIIFIYTSYARDLKLSKETENENLVKGPKLVKQKLKVKSLRNTSKKKNVSFVNKHMVRETC